MKYIVIVPDGAADYPIEALGGKTPLEAADTPFLDNLAANGIVGRVNNVPRGFPSSSDVANLSLFGYDPRQYYTGRAPLEAANLGVNLQEGDLAFRCNLITTALGRLTDYSAGHIVDKEAKILVEHINEKLGSDTLKFYPGTSYRHLLVVSGGKDKKLDKVKCVPPHDIIGEEIKRYLPRSGQGKLLTDLMVRSQEILMNHPINKVRIDLGENPANMIWLWGSGVKPKMPSFKEKFGLTGAVISAVDLIKGIGRIIGLEVINVEGANGYYDTNYKGKAQAALKALKSVDFVFVHIEATDEAGHNGDLRMKIACIERIDKLVVGTILEGLAGEDFRILVCPDHPTPVAKRTHTSEPVPFLLYGRGAEKSGVASYCEAQANAQDLYFDNGAELLNQLLSKQAKG